MRQQNFQAYYEGKGGLSNYGSRPAELDEVYGRLGEPALRVLVTHYLMTGDSLGDRNEKPLPALKQS